ncbi:Trypsin, partial [Operophtera brumata]
YPGIVLVESQTLLYPWSHSCAANILTSTYLVSAAHCFDGMVNHPSYGSGNGMDADISVVQLVSRLTFDNTIAAVAIVPQAFELPDNLPVVLAGWGNQVPQLAMLAVPASSVVSPPPSSSTLPYNRRIRAGTTNRNSGGTVIGVNSRVNHPSYGSNGMDADISLVQLSSGLTFSNTINSIPIPPQGFQLPDNLPVGCADAFYPGVSTQVSSYTDWIVANAA